MNGSTLCPGPVASARFSTTAMSNATGATWRDSVEVLYSAEAIAERVAALGAEITRAYQGRPLCVVGVLKGSFLFYADLVRQIDLPLTCEFIGISSYGDDTESSG